MAKRTIEDLIKNDKLGLLQVNKSKSKKLSTDNIFVGIYEDIRFFIKKNGREPSKLALSINEAQLGARLESIRKNNDAIEILAPFDQELQLLRTKNTDSDVTVQPVSGLKNSSTTTPKSLKDILNSELLKVDDSIFDVKKTISWSKTQSTNEYQARRTKCEDFHQFSGLFKQIQHDLDTGVRKTSSVDGIADIKKGQSFIVGGLIAYVAEVGEKYEHRKGHHNARTRIIFSNGMESDLLLRSFGASLYKDKTARVISGGTEGPLFVEETKTVKAERTGSVYVLKSNSDLPQIKNLRPILHKIGVTSGCVKSRISGAVNDPTYLLADVELVAEFTLYGLNPKAVEKVLHTFFDTARAKITIPDRFGKSVQPREWFIVPISAINDALELLQNGKLELAVYDVVNARIKF